MSIVDTIKERIKDAGASFKANDNISQFIHNDEEREQIKLEVQYRVSALLDSLIIDTENDHNTRDTAKRISRMYVDEILSGRYHPMPSITDFPNCKNLDEIYTLGPVGWKSICSHHFVEITGDCWIGIQPSDRVIGISKLARIANWVARRPHIQEEATIILANHLEEILKPKGLGVVIKAKHHCLSFRGVKEEETSMITSVVRESFLYNDSIKQEFFRLIKAQGF